MRHHATRHRARPFRALLLVIVAASVFGGAAPAMAAPADLIDATPTSVAVDAPAPGQSRSWDIEVTNRTSDALTLDLAVSGRADVLFSGPTPLQLTVAEKETGTILLTGSTADLLGHTVDLPRMTGSQRYELVGTIALPASAGDAYQAQSGTLDLRFTATAADKAPTGALAVTGALLTPALVAGALAVVGLVTGTILITRARRRMA